MTEGQGERVMDIVERLRDWGKFGVSRGDFVAYSHEAADEIERLRNAIKVQANAVRVLHEAETSELNLLRKNAQEAYTAKATLDSEREANKILTDEIERLRNALRQITELSPFKFNTGHASLQYITQMLVEMTALAHEALKEKE